MEARSSLEGGMASRLPRLKLSVVRLVAEIAAGLGIVVSLIDGAGSYLSFIDDLGIWVNQLILNDIPYPGLFLISFPVFVGLMLTRYITFMRRPRLKLSLAEIRDDGEASNMATYVRVEAENQSRRVAAKCTASLRRVERLGASGPREYSLPLDWTDIGETAVDIGPGETERLDVAKAIKTGNKFTHCSRKRPPRFVEDMPPGDYVFTVVAKTAGRASEPFKFGIKWDGKWDGLKQFEVGNT
jgi:hypothetical protein